MSAEKRLKVGAIAFAIFWTIGMVWWNGAHDPAGIIILSVCGGIAAVLWYFAMRWWMRRQAAQKG